MPSISGEAPLTLYTVYPQLTGTTSVVWTNYSVGDVAFLSAVAILVQPTVAWGAGTCRVTLTQTRVGVVIDYGSAASPPITTTGGGFPLVVPLMSGNLRLTLAPGDFLIVSITDLFGDSAAQGIPIAVLINAD